MANYVKQVWIDGTTPVDKAHMDVIESGIFAAVPADGVAVAGSRVLANYLTGADTQPVFRVMGDGKHEWGPGGATAPDANFYRSAVGVLKSDGRIVASGGFFADAQAGGIGGVFRGSQIIGAAVFANYLLSADAQPAYRVFGNGKIEWGDGGASVTDTNLYRSAAGVLKTDAHFRAVGQIVVDFGGAGNALYFGSVFDTNLYRASAGNLKTDGNLIASGLYFSVSDAAANLYRSAAGVIKTDGVFAASGGGYFGGTVYFGTAGANYDTYLYRSAAASLQTDGSLIASGGFNAAGMASGGSAAWQSSATGDSAVRFTFNAGGFMQWGPGSAVVDTNLYRSAANSLSTDGNLRLGLDFVVRNGAAQQLILGSVTGGALSGILFGSANDTNLYRTASTVLKTDGSFRVAQYLDVDFAATGGQLRFGSAVDTNLYRSAANTLKTDGNFFAAAAIVSGVGGAGQVQVTSGATPTILFGSAADTNLFRFAADFLGTNDDFVARLSNSGQVSLQSQGGVPYIFFGNAQDTTLFRSAANYLKTDGSFRTGAELRVFTDVVVNENNTGKVYFGSALDTNLYRNGAADLKTDGAFEVAKNLFVAQDNTSRLYFGSNNDTNLYRSAAGVLKTDGTLLHASPGARVYNNATISIPNGVTTYLTFNSERFDTDTIHDTVTNNSRLTCKTAGKYIIVGHVRFFSNQTGTMRLASIRLNGATEIARHSQSPAIVPNVEMSVTTIYDLAVNDYVELGAYQDSGGALGVEVAAQWSPEFSMMKIG
jgi:hypothetical protein